MASLIQIFGTNSTLNSTDSNDLILNIHWNDLKAALNASSGTTPNTGEDWLAGILYNCMDATSTLGQDVKRINVSALQPSIGTWNNARSRIFTLSCAFAITDTGEARPGATEL